MKDYIFLKRKYQTPMWVYILTLLGCLLIVGYMEKQEYIARTELKAIKSQYNALKATNIQMWYMDSSCATQLKNSEMVQLKIKK